MIPVTPQPEYAGFDAEVRALGLRFLTANPTPSSREFRRHAYWSRARAELGDAYRHCAYSTLRLVGLEESSVDHFLPKVRHPKLAYEWSNYRLSRPRLNNSKGDSVCVLDPFAIRSGWFALRCPSCLVAVGEDVAVAGVRNQIRETIEILDLNGQFLSAERCAWLVDLAKGDITFPYVEKMYPFLAREVRRQGLLKDLGKLFAV